MKSAKSVRHLSDAHRKQISVLRALYSESHGSQSRHLELAAIAELSGLDDEKEVLRYLYILEGHKLVSPHPPGSFTSKFWHITSDGVKAMKTISRELFQEAA